MNFTRARRLKIVLFVVAVAALLFCIYQNRRLICNVDETEMQKLMNNRMQKSVLKTEFAEIAHVLSKTHPDCCIVRKYDENPDVFPDDTYHSRKSNNEAYYYIKLSRRYFKDVSPHPDDPGENVYKRYFVLFEADQCGKPLTLWNGNPEHSRGYYD